MPIPVGTRILIYSDGLTDALPPQGGAEAGLAFGTQGLMKTLQSCRDRDIEKTLEHLFQTTSEYTGGLGRHDDTSVVLLERFAEERAPVYFRRDADVSTVLRQLRASGTRIGVFTDAPAELARIALSHLGAERHVEVVETGPGAQQRVSTALGEGVQVIATRTELLAVT